MVEYVSQIDFQYSPFQDDILIVGGKGEGKTEKAKEILTTIPQIPKWIWDYSKRFQGYGILVDKVEDLKYGSYVIQPKDLSLENYVRFLNKANFEIGDGVKNLVVVTDELHQYVTKQDIMKPLYHLVLSGRNKGISSIFITTRTHSVPNYILSNIEHLFALPLKLQSDIEWLTEYIGLEAWLLLPKDKRKKGFFDSPEDIDSLPKYSFIYRKMSNNNPQIVRTGVQIDDSKT